MHHIAFRLPQLRPKDFDWSSLILAVLLAVLLAFMFVGVASAKNFDKASAVGTPAHGTWTDTGLSGKNPTWIQATATVTTPSGLVTLQISAILPMEPAMLRPCCGDSGHPDLAATEIGTGVGNAQKPDHRELNLVKGENAAKQTIVSGSGEVDSRNPGMLAWAGGSTTL